MSWVMQIDYKIILDAEYHNHACKINNMNMHDLLCSTLHLIFSKTTSVLKHGSNSVWTDICLSSFWMMIKFKMQFKEPQDKKYLKAACSRQKTLKGMYLKNLLRRDKSTKTLFLCSWIIAVDQTHILANKQLKEILRVENIIPYEHF